MADVLILDMGGADMVLRVVAASERAPLTAGALERSAAGRQGGRILWEKWVRTFDLLRMDTTEWDALVALTPPGAILPCGGIGLTQPLGLADGTAVDCVVRRGEHRFIRHGTTVRHATTLTLEEA